MFIEITLNYFHPGLNLGMENIRTAWLLNNNQVKLNSAVHRGNLVFRIPGSGKRISYRLLKKGLIQNTIILKQQLELLPF